VQDRRSERGRQRPPQHWINYNRLSDFGKICLHAGQADSREPEKLSLIALKNMQNLRICHALMLLAFGGAAVLGWRGVLKSAES